MVGRNVYVEQSQTLGVSPKYDRVTKEQLSMTQKKKRRMKMYGLGFYITLM